MNLLNTIVAFAVALGSLIVVHEFGHYLAARLCNVKVLRFSVGFGRVLASRRLGRDQTEWALSAFPLGGYVKMLDEREGEVAEADLPRAFNRQRVSKRFIIVAAGPVANFLLAIFLYWLIFMHGAPGMKPVIGAITPGSAAAQAQFASGETITKIGRDSVATWQDARWMLLKYAVDHATVPLEVQNADNEIRTRSLDTSSLKTEDLDGDFLKALGFARLQPPLPPVVEKVIAGGPAERAGLRAGDEIVAIDKKPVTRWDEVVAEISASAGRERVLEVRRGSEMLSMAVTPDAVVDNAARIGRIGAAPRVDKLALQKVHGRSSLLAIGELWQSTRTNMGYLCIQPAHAREDGDGPSVAQEFERADNDCGLRRPVRADRVDLVPRVHRAHQHQSRRAEFIAHSLIGWGAFDVLYY